MVFKIKGAYQVNNMLTLSQRLSQQQKLSPQQIQYQKLLQLNTLALEQRIKTELEINPILEERLKMKLSRHRKKKKMKIVHDEFEDVDKEEFELEDFMNDSDMMRSDKMNRSNDEESYPAFSSRKRKSLSEHLQRAT